MKRLFEDWELWLVVLAPVLFIVVSILGFVGF
jgi:hypothetical protein